MYHPSPETLGQLKPMQELSEVQLKLLAQSLQVYTAPIGKILIPLGDTADYSLYLLKGQLQLRSSDNRHMEITDHTPQAMGPIASLIPRQYQIKALTPVEYLLVDNHLLKGLFSPESQGITATELEAEEGEYTLDETEGLLAQSLSEDLENDCLKLPSLPDVAIRVGQAMKDETTNAHKLAKIIQTDPAITTKLIRAANSPLYAGVSAVDTCKEAVVRLGSSTTHKLVLTFALRELFNTRSSVLKNRMQKLWEHSVKVSAICYVLAKLSNKQFNPEHALLAGLLHDIGVIAILSYAERFPDIANDEQELNTVIHDMRGPIGAQILQTWGFMEDLVTVAKEAENWQRENRGPADYADLVIIAQLHCFIGSPMEVELPSLDQVPAFNKLGIGQLSPKLSIKILDKAQEKIARAESLLST
ncbi:MAG: HDOD domain-containing protein [Gammaproteobacteria bacterium]|nr:HDOD domain-containing protein [Gammaproteobacteria bacterium]